MADFYKVVAPTLSFEGGYQAQPSDPGNYCNGQLIGTNHGIAAGTLAQYHGGQCPTVAQMKALTKAEAIDVFHKLFWNGLINGDKIKDQYVAFICFQCIIGAPVNIVYARKGINAIAAKYGKQKVQENAVAFNDFTVSVINSLPPKELFEAIYNLYYERLLFLNKTMYAHDPQNGWFTRMETIKSWAMSGFAKAVTVVENNPVKTALGVAFFLPLQDGDTNVLPADHPTNDKESVV